MSLPHVPIFAKDWIVDTRHLTLEQRGAYMDILLFSWVSPDCSCPDDDKEIARILGCTVGRWKAKIRPSIEPFFEIENGKWIQKTLKKVRKNVEKRVEISKQNGSKGGRPVSNDINDLENPVGSLQDNPDGTQTETISKLNSNTVSSLRSDTSAEAPIPDERDILFGECLRWLAKQSASTEKQCRSIIGRWLKIKSPSELLAICRDAQSHRPAEPISYITRIVSDERTANPKPRQNANGSWIEAANNLRVQSG